MTRVSRYMVGFATVALMTLTAAPARPCSCLLPDLSRELGEADAVFSGRVVAIAPPEMTYEVELEVLETFRGALFEPLGDLLWEARFPSCGQMTMYSGDRPNGFSL